MDESPRMFHLILESDWRQKGNEETWSPGSLATEGFIHLSFREQLQGTLDVHFKGVDSVFLVEVEGLEDDEALRVETSRGGALFPHLYRALTRGEMTRWWRLRRGETGWELPQWDEADPTKDWPQGKRREDID